MRASNDGHHYTLIILVLNEVIFKTFVIELFDFRGYFGC